MAGGKSPIRHTRILPKRSIARTAGIVVLALALTFGTSTAIAFYRLQSNIQAVDIGNLRTDDSKPKAPVDLSAGRALNIVLIGTDDRSGANADIGGKDEGQRSDTTIIAHISADRSRVELVSIPRDSLVKIPSCKGTNGRTSRPQTNAMFNSAFAVGWELAKDLPSAVACTVATIETNTGLTIDGFAVADFEGFIGAVDAIGGVPVCLSKRFNPDNVQIDLPPGKHMLTGINSVEFVRARKGIADGSDLSRIQRQQYFLRNAFKEMTSTGTLANPAKIYGVASSVTKSLTVSKELGSLSAVAGLVYSLRSVNLSNMATFTVPSAPYPRDPNRQIWTREADALWERLRNDKPEPSTSSAPGSGGTQGPGTDSGGVSGDSGVSGQNGEQQGSHTKGNKTSTKAPSPQTPVTPETQEDLPGGLIPCS